MYETLKKQRRWFLVFPVILVIMGMLIPANLTAESGTLPSGDEDPEKKGTRSSSTGGGDAIPQPTSKKNPFTNDDNRVVPGDFVKIKVEKKVTEEKGWAIENIRLVYKITEDKTTTLIDPPVKVDTWYFKETNGKLFLYAGLPNWDRLEKIRTQPALRGVFTPYRAKLLINFQNSSKGETRTESFPLELPDWRWALWWGFFLALVLLLLVSWLVSWNSEQFSMRKLFISAKTDAKDKGKISVSKTQIVIWTYTILFGLIYVYCMSETFLAITSQMLFLLGISGGTAVAAKYNAVNKSLANNGQPTAAGSNASNKGSVQKLPDFYKVQMLTFTIVIAVIVFIEIVKSNIFPELSPELVMVMGISNSVYLGNKFIGSSDNQADAAPVKPADTGTAVAGAGGDTGVAGQ